MDLKYYVVSVKGGAGSYGVARRAEVGEKVAAALTNTWAKPARLVSPGPWRFKDALDIAQQLNEQDPPEEL